MYAIIETGGEQLRVTTGDVVSVEKVIGDVNYRDNPGQGADD